MKSLCTTCKDKVACDAHRRCYGYPNYRVKECISYEPKTEPFDKDINVRSKDEPQTEDEILREQCRAFMGIVEQTERSE